MKEPEYGLCRISNVTPHVCMSLNKLDLIKFHSRYLHPKLLPKLQIGFMWFLWGLDLGEPVVRGLVYSASKDLCTFLQLLLTMLD